MSILKQFSPQFEYVFVIEIIFDSVLLYKVTILEVSEGSDYEFAVARLSGFGL